jgi:hypothetical protein
MLELYSPAFKTQPVNIIVLPPYQQEWTIPFLALGSLDCFAFTGYDSSFLTQVQPAFGV